MDDWSYWMAQAVGTVAALLGIAAFQLRSNTTLLLVLAASAFTWAAHFLFLGAPAAAAINVVTGLRNVSGVYLRARAVGLLFIAGYVSAAAATFESAWDLLPLCAVVAGTMSVFFFTGIWVRLGFLTGSVLWVIFNIRVGSLPGIAMMAADGASNLIFICRARTVRRTAMLASLSGSPQILWRRLFRKPADEE